MDASMLKRLYDAVLHGDSEQAVELTRNAVSEDNDLQDIIKNAYVPAMYEVGERFQRGEFYIPEMLIAAKAMKDGMDIIKPLIKKDQMVVGKVVLGTVAGDLHDMGKNLVGIMLEGAGYTVIDLGTNVSSEAFIKAVQDNEPDVVGLSALITTTMSVMAITIKAFKEAGVRDKVKVIVGGAPVTSDFALQIGADGYAEDAGGAINLVRGLVPARC
jgi:5-methyltetrahydrofolate--homocysteine methyltransferase